MCAITFCLHAWRKTIELLFSPPKNELLSAFVDLTLTSSLSCLGIWSLKGLSVSQFHITSPYKLLEEEIILCASHVSKYNYMSLT